ncbi:MAG: H4MPT-linked C1 transfer pathway protein [Planctomycetota bacterium]|nr:MAG: H4MPT-linked C1 transfer pathway protein [Planctomycetota bacterium]
MTWLAFDIGGANIKSADGIAFAESRSFAMWQRPQLLVDTLRAMIAEAPPADHLAVTMTGELADCFATKTEGVLHILAAVEKAADRRHTRVYCSDGTLRAIEAVRRTPLAAAAANWHALARFASRFAKQGPALLIDVGTTTTDLVPLADGVIAAAENGDGSRSDTHRLIAGEMVYTGVERSPVCAVVGAIPYRGRQCPVAQELFATTWDAYLTLGELPEEPLAAHTADGRPATKSAARDRLARAICADRESFDETDACAAAEAIVQAQTAKIGLALAQQASRMKSPPATVILSGLGEFLARRVLQRAKFSPTIVSLSEKLGPALSVCAPAHALAVIAREESQQ